MRNKQHIKRCPMCGGKAGIYQDYHSFYLVQCNRCGISTLHRADLHTALYEWYERVSTSSGFKIYWGVKLKEAI